MIIKRHQRTSIVALFLFVLGFTAVGTALLRPGKALDSSPYTVASANPNYKIGPNYYATGTNFQTDAFISRYNEPGVRDLVKSQLKTMADAGANTIKTPLWLVYDSTKPTDIITQSERWRLGFPLSKQELTNLSDYVKDVASIRNQNGEKLDLEFSLNWLGCADYVKGSASTTVGLCGFSWKEFINRAQTTVSSLLTTLSSAQANSANPQAIKLVYLEAEVMIGPKPNQDQFLKDMYPYALQAGSTNNIPVSLYFNATTDENNVLDDSFQDGEYPAINGHKTLFWVYRSTEFLRKNNLPVPERLDFSAYLTVIKSSYDVLAARLTDDVSAVYGPTKKFVVSETNYFQDQAKRTALGQAFSKQNARTGTLQQTLFWTTPDGGNPDNVVGPPFDFAAFKPAILDTRGKVSASPNPCLIRRGSTCKVTVSWEMRDTTAKQAQVFIKTTGSNKPTQISCSLKGSSTVSNIQTVGTEITLHTTTNCQEPYTANTIVDKVLVRGTKGTINASPNPCTIQPGANTCQTTITWEVLHSSIKQAQIWVKVGTNSPKLVACGLKGSTNLPWIQAGQYTFLLYPTTTCNSTEAHQNPLETIVVSGIR